MQHIEDPISVPADITGPHGRAWTVDMVDWCRRIGKDPAEFAQVAGWLIEAPWAHPLWHSYLLSVIHLRPMPDNRPTKLYLEGATHDLWLAALDPDHPRQAMIETGAVRQLRPLNFAAQFIAASDAAAMERAEHAVRLICDGRLSPDTDFTSAWVALFGDNMLRSAADAAVR